MRPSSESSAGAPTMKTPFLPGEASSSHVQSYQSVPQTRDPESDLSSVEHAPVSCDKYFLRHLALSFLVICIIVFTWAFSSSEGVAPWFVYPVGMLIYILCLHYFLIVRNTNRSRVTLHLFLLLCWSAMYIAPWLHLDRADAEFPWFVFPIAVGLLPLHTHYCKVFHPGNYALIHLGYYLVVSVLILVLFSLHGEGIAYFGFSIVLWGGVVAYQFYDQRKSLEKLRTEYLVWAQHVPASEALQLSPESSSNEESVV